MGKMNTYIGKFNFYLNSFLNELIVIFPENKSCFEKNYQEIIDNKESVNETYIKDYMDKISEYHSDIAKKNDKLFKSDKEIYLLKDIDFRDLWSKDLSDTTRENLWKYLQTLYVLGKKIATSDDEVSNMLDELNSENIPEPEFDEMKQMMENMSKITQNVKKDENINDLFNNGIISDIAKELTNEIDISKMDVGEPKNMNEAFNNIMGGSGGNNFFDLINKAQKMMGGLKNPEQLARNMKQQNNSNPTRNRLRKKLEKRNKESNT